jgi:hypothetical protein
MNGSKKAVLSMKFLTDWKQIYYAPRQQWPENFLNGEMEEKQFEKRVLF